MTVNSRALSLAWGLAFMGLVYSELNTPPTQNSLTALLDALTIDGPAAGMGLLTGATVTHMLKNWEDPAVARHRVLVFSGFLMISGMVLASIQSAIYPISFILGVVALCSLGFARLNSFTLTCLLAFTTFASAFVHTVFAIRPPVGGQYPALAWLAYGICGVLLFRVIDNKKVSVSLLFITGVIVGMVGMLTVLPNYLPDLFGVDPAVSKYYRENPPTTTIRYFSSIANSGGLLNVVGNFAAGTNLLTLGYLLQRFRFFEPVVASGRMSFSTYPFYIIIAAITMGGFSGFAEEINTAIDNPNTTVAHHKALDWQTFDSWVENSNSWADLSSHEIAYYGPDSESLINETKTKQIEPTSFLMAYPVAIIGNLVVSTLWMRFFSDGLIELLLFRRQRREGV
ncbi:hypothetical protein [Corynebacterium sp. H130]|uniref:hypothetical protein n=1 Tax=Corynebacterium sp. H130 TaxID=3133444 RepID=UPI0030B13A0D